MWTKSALKWGRIKQNNLSCTCSDISVCLWRMEGLSWTTPVPWLSMRAVSCGPTSPSSVCCPSAPVATTTPRGHLPHPPAGEPKSATWSAVPRTPKGCTRCWTICWLRTCTSASTPCWVPWCPWTRAGHRPWTSCRETPRIIWRETGPNWPGCVWCWRQSVRLWNELRTGWVRGPGRWSSGGCEKHRLWAEKTESPPKNKSPDVETLLFVST